MAGGMTPGRAGRSLRDRAASSGVPAPDAREQAPVRPGRGVTAGLPNAPGPAGEGGEGRHCWVRNPPDTPGIWPGLLVEWRQRDGAWQGRVAYTVTGAHGPTLVEAWLPAARLEPR
jgi:hypothetical protein